MKNSLFKKVLLFFGFALLLSASFTYGVFSERNQTIPSRIVWYLNAQNNKIFPESEGIKKGSWGIARNDLPNQGLADEQRESLAKVTALPYLKGYNSAPHEKNVTVYDKEAAYNGLNLVVSGHGTEAILTDMEGKILHRGNNGKSKIIEVNPLNQKIAWTYKGTQAQEFFSMTAGTTKRLPNGNTLITESNNGRAFEVTPEGKIVWEFFNPYRAGEDNELIAALYDVVRYDQNQFDWLSLDAKPE